MFAQSKLHVVVPLANDAIDDQDGKYHEVGDNFKCRMRTALYEAWGRQVGSNARVMIALGAGTDMSHAHGPTLAEICEHYVLSLSPDLPVLVNRSNKSIFGTLAEMRWIVNRVYECIDPSVASPQFVFVTQQRHLQRVRFIARWFFPNIDACFIESGQTKEIPVLHEVFAYTKLVLTLCGLGWMADSIRRRLHVSIDAG